MAPDHFGPEITGPVFKFSLDTLDIEHRGLHYNYEVGDPAIIRVRYNNNCAIVIAVGDNPSEAFCQLLLPGGKKIHAKSAFSSKKFQPIFVMPPVGALLAEETQRDKKYLYKHINGYLSYRHIRNQMADMPNEFGKFRDLLIQTWSSVLQIGDIEYGLGELQNQYGLTVRDGPFVSEMALVGSGLQAWIQTVWFLSRVDPDSIVVLDQPDVYLHADLQKKPIKILSAESYRQTIVATHSMEMIADVSPSEIVSVTKRAPRSRPLSSSVQAQSVVEAIGTNLNIQLSKLANSGRILFVEGKDYAYLDQIAYKLSNTFYDKFSKIPHFSVGGMNNWPRAAMAAKAFHDTSAGKVDGIMFIDRDYKPHELFAGVIDDAKKDFLEIHVWKKKEIENYFLNSTLIHSYIENRSKTPVDYSDVVEMVSSIVRTMFSELLELIADGYQTHNRKLALPTAMNNAKAYLESCATANIPPEDLICGKKALSKLSGESQERWGVPIPPMSLCRHMKLSDVPEELVSAVQNLVN